MKFYDFNKFCVPEDWQFFHTCQFGKNTRQNLTKLYMDVNTNFVKYLWNFGVNLCIMNLRKNWQSFKLSKMADPGAAQDWARFLNFVLVLSSTLTNQGSNRDLQALTQCYLNTGPIKTTASWCLSWGEAETASPDGRHHQFQLRWVCHSVMLLLGYSENYWRF